MGKYEKIINLKSFAIDNFYSVQNGPGKFSFGNDVFKHLFDGSALLQKEPVILISFNRKP